MERLKERERERELTCRTTGISIERMAKELALYLRGRIGYFGNCLGSWFLRVPSKLLEDHEILEFRSLALPGQQYHAYELRLTQGRCRSKSSLDSTVGVRRAV
jgi:hypothetical protein